MKRFATLVGLALAVALVFALTGCGSSVSGSNSSDSATAERMSPFVGVWEVTSLDDGERHIGLGDIEKLADLDMHIYAEFDADGNVTLRLFDEEESGTWTASSQSEGELELANGEKVPMSLEDGVLSFTQNSDKLTFEKTDLETMPTLKDPTTTDSED